MSICVAYSYWSPYTIEDYNWYCFGILARAVGIPVGLHSGRRLATTYDHNKRHYFLFLSFLFSFSPACTFLIEWVIWLKNLFCHSWRERQKPRGRHLSRPQHWFYGPQAAIYELCRHLGIAGVSALQAVSECPGAARLVLLLVSPIQVHIVYW